jgi:hypothetical protein
VENNHLQVEGYTFDLRKFKHVYVIARKVNSKVTLLHIAEAKLANLKPEAVRSISEKNSLGCINRNQKSRN